MDFMKTSRLASPLRLITLLLVTSASTGCSIDKHFKCESSEECDPSPGWACIQNVCQWRDSGVPDGGDPGDGGIPCPTCDTPFAQSSDLPALLRGDLVPDASPCQNEGTGFDLNVHLPSPDALEGDSSALGFSWSVFPGQGVAVDPSTEKTFLLAVAGKNLVAFAGRGDDPTCWRWSLVTSDLFVGAGGLSRRAAIVFSEASSSAIVAAVTGDGSAMYLSAQGSSISWGTQPAFDQVEIALDSAAQVALIFHPTNQADSRIGFFGDPATFGTLSSPQIIGPSLSHPKLAPVPAPDPWFWSNDGAEIQTLLNGTLVSLPGSGRPYAVIRGEGGHPWIISKDAASDTCALHAWRARTPVGYAAELLPAASLCDAGAGFGRARLKAIRISPPGGDGILLLRTLPEASMSKGGLMQLEFLVVKDPKSEPPRVELAQGNIGACSMPLGPASVAPAMASTERYLHLLYADTQDPPAFVYRRMQIAFAGCDISVP